MKIKLFFKRLLQLGFIILIGFIIYSNLRLNGTYYGIYRYSETTETKWPNDMFLYFNNFSYDERHGMHSGENIGERFFIAIGDEIRFKSNDSQYQYFNMTNVLNINMDSLVLQPHYQQTLVYKKIPDSLKQKKEITFFNEKLVELSFNGKKDTVYINDKYLLFKNNNHPNEKWTNYYYEIKSFNDFKILISNSSFRLILTENNKNISFHLFDKNGLRTIKTKVIKSNDLINDEIDKKFEEMKKSEERERKLDSI